MLARFLFDIVLVLILTSDFVAVLIIFRMLCYAICCTHSDAFYLFTEFMYSIESFCDETCSQILAWLLHNLYVFRFSRIHQRTPNASELRDRLKESCLSFYVKAISSVNVSHSVRVRLFPNYHLTVDTLFPH